MKLAYFFLLSFSCTSFASSLMNKDELLKLDKNNYTADAFLIENEREQVVFETAFAYSSQTSFLKTLKFHESRALNNKEELSESYDFRQLMKIAASQAQSSDPSLELVILPAVLIKSENVQKLSLEGDILRIKDEVYKIIRHSKLVTAPPTWKDYLFSEEFYPPAKPIKALLPKDDKERAIWQKGINEGWQEGIKQANKEMRNRIRALSVEWRGMLTYISLVQKKMIVPAFVSMQRTPLVSQQDGMEINELIYRITEKDQFNFNAPAWDSAQGDDREHIRSLSDVYKASKWEAEK